MKLTKEIIIQAANAKGFNPYKTPFKPSDLNLKSNDYGSFSDYCSPKETTSGKWRKEDTILTVAEWRNNKPYKYFLI